MKGFAKGYERKVERQGAEVDEEQLKWKVSAGCSKEGIFGGSDGTTETPGKVFLLTLLDVNTVWLMFAQGKG